MNWRALVTFGAGLFMTAPAWAATVQALEGRTFIDRGNGFQQVSGQTEANVGDQVMVSPDGKARIVYQDGCEATVLPSVVVYVRDESPCKAGFVMKPGRFVIGAAVVGGIAAGVALGVGGNGNEKSKIMKPEKAKPASP